MRALMPQVLVLGCGMQPEPVPEDVSKFLAARGIKMEVLDSVRLQQGPGWGSIEGCTVSCPYCMHTPVTFSDSFHNRQQSALRSIVFSSCKVVSPALPMMTSDEAPHFSRLSVLQPVGRGSPLRRCVK